MEQVMLGARLLAALLTAGSAPAAPVESSGGVITEPTVTDVQYACRIGDAFSVVTRDPSIPVFVTRVVVGQRLLYELYERPAHGSVLLATCDYLAPVALGPTGAAGARRGPLALAASRVVVGPPG